MHILTQKPAKNRKANNMPCTTAPLLARGMSVEECKVVCTSPLIPLREKLFFRILYETGLRPMEVQHLRIENWNRTAGEVVALKVKQKWDRWRQIYIETPPRHVVITGTTNEMLRAVVSNRKKGYVFEGKAGKPLTMRYFEMELDNYARLLTIQKTRKITVDGKGIALITPMALRKAGERHHDAEGGDPSLSAQSCGHTMNTKIRHYQGEVDWDSVHKSYREHHPAFKEKW